MISNSVADLMGFSSVSFHLSNERKISAVAAAESLFG